MGEMKWTKEQSQVINLRDCNVLVSAAAGSGKTAVLIERICSRILDPVNPVDVDQFLVVTFTKAAAAQMKDRLQKAIELALSKDPDNEHLQHQLMLIPMAQISTIHSFCGYVIQNYFHVTGIDPAYRVGAESELGMIKSDVIQEMFEEKYAEAEDGFVELALMPQFLKNDAKLEQLIYGVYNQVISNPFPKKSIEQFRQFLSMDDVEQLENSDFIRENMLYAHNVLSGICEQYTQMISICESPDGPEAYKELLFKEQIELQELAGKERYDVLKKAIGLLEFLRLPSKRQPDVDPDKKELVKEMRNAVKKAVGQLKDDVFSESLDRLVEQLSSMRQPILEILNLTSEFMERYSARKREKSVVDFNDLEQMAIEILVEEDEDGNIVRSNAAKELSEQFEEIMIDEYQDSNLVQDMLLTSVARDNDLFMVGDIKQSIYRFRMACPELFIDKLNSYEQKDGALNHLVILGKNFRSRSLVLEAANNIFSKIMHPQLGGVEYDEDAKLYPGADYPDTNLSKSETVEVFVVDGKDDGTYEGKVIANRIHKYMAEKNPLYILEDGEYRKASYRDMVILARSTKNIGQQIYDVLAAEGIPVYMEKTQGFFDTREISIMVNLFTIIDNPRQDIPLVAVMKSPLFDFSDDELALIRGNNKKKDFYESLMEYDTEDEINSKIADFLSLLKHLRVKMTYAAVADIIEEIYDRTKIDHIMMAMSNGIQRKANLDMLMELARDFDSTSFRGLYQFVRYIRGIRDREEDFGETSVVGSKEDVVRIMTIHKSKGLEFPICFLAGMGKKMTGHDGKSFLTMNPSVGIASRIYDVEKGFSQNNAFFKSILRMNNMEDLGEELRVLYVAMTRAKEKLVFTGCAESKKIPQTTKYFDRIHAKSYYDWVLPAIAGDDLFDVKIIDSSSLDQMELTRQKEVLVDEVMLNNFDTTFTYHKELKEKLEAMDEYRQEEPEEIPTKLSVSEIKKRSMEQSEEEGFTVLYEDEIENQSPVPAFAREETDENEALAGAGYGTVWHQVMAGLDFSESSSEKEVENSLQNMIESGRIMKGDMRYIQIRKLNHFFASQTGKEMKRAHSTNQLFREQPFVIGVKAKDVVPDTENDSMVMVQGIIDAFYEREDGIVLLDYKTDHLEPGQENVLCKRYEKQMELYARALENITGKKVVKTVLYSFSLEKEISVER